MMEKLTLEERVARAARSQAASPEAAVELVRKLSQLDTTYIFHGNNDIDLMYEMIGPHLEQIGDDVLHYAGFCRGLQMASIHAMPQAELDAHSRMILETRFKNAVILLGLMLLDHAKGRGWDKGVYRCTRMTLGQYLDALETLAFPGDPEPGRVFRKWREQFLKSADPAAPLADVLADLLRQYIRGWTVLNFLSRVLYYMTKLSRSLEGDPDREFEEAMRQRIDEACLNLAEAEAWADEREEFQDTGKYDEERTVGPDQEFREAVSRCVAEARLAGAEKELEGHVVSGKDYFDLAVTCFWDTADPAGETISAGEMRDQLLLPYRDYSPQVLKELAEQAPTPAFRALLEQFISKGWPFAALREVNMAVSHLIMLWVGPYLTMGSARRKHR